MLTVQVNLVRLQDRGPIFGYRQILIRLVESGLQRIPSRKQPQHGESQHDYDSNKQPHNDFHLRTHPIPHALPTSIRARMS